MTLRLIREPTDQGTTLGSLYLDNRWVCWTLEDALREVSGQPVSAWKVPGETAIPAGTYPVRVTHSQRFQRRLPAVLNVPGFTGIRIHAGNTIADTSGCILVGFRRAQAAAIEQSRVALTYLCEQLDMGWHRIIIENPPDLP